MQQQAWPTDFNYHFQISSVTRIRHHFKIPNAALFFAALLVLLGASGSNFFVICFAATILLIGFALLWRPGESPILLWIFSYQWIQASAKAMDASFKGVDLNNLSTYGGDIELASYLSLTALGALACGMRWGVGRQQYDLSQSARALALQYGMRKWFGLYVLTYCAAFIAGFLAWRVPALTQPLLALAALKWAFFFMVTYAAFVRPLGDRLLWLLVFGFEFLMGFGGYFAGFTNVLVFTLMGVLAAGVRFTAARIFILTLIGSLTLVFAILWTAVKPDYRNFVSQGASAQIVEVSYLASLAKLNTLVTNISPEDFELATQAFVDRIGYIDFFGATIHNVPSVVPHTNGEIWFNAIILPLMPRILFPEKPEIHDSDATRRYSGVQVAGANQGTSISIGYAGESYIDFGPALMVVPILGFGWMLGKVYRWLTLRSAAGGLAGMGIASASLFVASRLESSITKMFGALIAALLVAWILSEFVIPRYLRWLATGKNRTEQTTTIPTNEHRR